MNYSISALKGSALEHRYRIAQFHFHWGKTNETGSEHRINGKMYAAEVCFLVDLACVSNSRAQTDTEDKEKMRMKIFEINTRIFLYICDSKSQIFCDINSCISYTFMIVNSIALTVSLYHEDMFS